MTFFIEQYEENGEQRASIVRYGANGEPEYKEAYHGSTAQEWLEMNGFGATQLVSLLDLENQLRIATKTSQKMLATRAWINDLVMQHASDPRPQINFSAPPFPFNDVLSEALGVLTDHLH